MAEIWDILWAETGDCYHDTHPPLVRLENRTGATMQKGLVSYLRGTPVVFKRFPSWHYQRKMKDIGLEIFYIYLPRNLHLEAM